jgi:hypothetical protein
MDNCFSQDYLNTIGELAEQTFSWEFLNLRPLDPNLETGKAITDQG